MNGFFYPKTVALIGASNKKGKIGNDILKNLMLSKAKIIPVNVKKGKIGGKDSYSNVLDYKGIINLAIIAIPAKFAEQALLDCAKKGIKNAIIISAGFAEAGNIESEKNLSKICEENNIKMIGPNCLGIINPHNSFNASFFSGKISKGGISFVSQSGAIGVSMLDKSIIENIGFCKFISIGNMANIDFADCIDYLSKDEDTKAICLYIEGIKNGKKFIKAAKACKKPIIALKAGSSESSAKAIESHTGSLAGDSKIIKSIFKQFNIINAHSLNEMVLISKFLSENTMIKSPKACIITNAGGLGVLAADACEKAKIILPDLPLKIKKDFDNFLPSHWSKRNPIDILGDALANRYESSFNALSKSNFFEILLAILTPQSSTEPEKTMKSLIEFKKINPKIAVFSCFSGGERVKKAIEMGEKNGIMNFDEPYYFAKIISRITE